MKSAFLSGSVKGGGWIATGKNARGQFATFTNSRNQGQNMPSVSLCQPNATYVPITRHYILRFLTQLSLAIDAGQDTASAFRQNGPSLTLNPIEQVWRKTRREKTHNHYFPSISEVISTRDEYFGRFISANDELKSLCSFGCFAWYHICFQGAKIKFVYYNSSISLFGKIRWTRNTPTL